MGKDLRRQAELAAGESATPAVSAAVPTVQQLFFSFLWLGAVSFGGPGMVAYIKRLSVARKRWLCEEDFQQGVALCQAVPGATAMQCAAYVGLRTRRLGGAVAAYLGFGLPAFLLMFALSTAYQQALSVPTVISALTGLRALVVALVANAAWTFGRSSIKSLHEGLISALTAALFLLGGSPFLIVIGAGLFGPIILRRRTPQPQANPYRLVGWRSFRLPAIVLGLAAGLVTSLLVIDSRLATLGLIMMKVDIFAFGGGFASVPLMFREVVDVRGWMPANVFMDGIALGQVTPGPIVITATFVGHQVAGIAGSMVGSVCIFLPSIFVVVLAEPWFRRFRSSPVFDASARALVLSFVGLIASVTVQFAKVAPWSIASCIVAGLTLVALLLKVDVVWVVLAGGAVSAMLL